MKKNVKNSILTAGVLTGLLLTPMNVCATDTQTTLVNEPPVYSISVDHWSREDYSQQANPAAFTGTYDRTLYNALRQSIVDGGAENSTDGKCAYTAVTPEGYSKVRWLMGRMDGAHRHKVYIPDRFINYYEYPGYLAMTMTTPEEYKAPLEYVQPVLDEVRLLESDREKVECLSNYLGTLLNYRKGATAVIQKIFAPTNTGSLAGSCGTYATAFNFLCSAVGIPCVKISSTNHTWNLVYVDGYWLHVDAAANDNPGSTNVLLAESNLHGTDREPDVTEFLKELLVPASTLKKMIHRNQRRSESGK